MRAGMVISLASVHDFGLGVSASPLRRGADCPANAAYLDGYYADADGEPVEAGDVVCVFERYAGDIAASGRRH